jgi:hypothetical protein
LDPLPTNEYWLTQSSRRRLASRASSMILRFVRGPSYAHSLCLHREHAQIDRIPQRNEWPSLQGFVRACPAQFVSASLAGLLILPRQLCSARNARFLACLEPHLVAKSGINLTLCPHCERGGMKMLAAIIIVLLISVDVILLMRIVRRPTRLWRRFIS